MENALALKEKKNVFRMKEAGVLIALAILFLFFCLTTDSFLTAQNLLNILRQVSLLGIMTVGMTMVLVTGEFDLSVGSTFGMTGMLAGIFMTSGGMPVWLSILLGIAIGLGIGLVNGLLVTYAKIPSFIVTLGMLNVARGFALVVTGGLVVAVNDKTARDVAGIESFFFIGGGKVGEIPVMIFLFIAVIAVGFFLLHRTIIGFWMKAVGGNASAAKAVGINVNLVKITGFAILGALAGLAGIINLAFLTNVQGTTGQGMELNVIAATVIGGTSVSGGEGTILGAVIGVLLTGVLNNGLILIGASSFIQTICIGAVIIGAVAIDVWTRKKQ
ncbi:MAG: ABC transporter permease [Clostridiales Family XIII bacterium]|jgi:ribose/xylose/arabinose/galactoside ABC-type transport system permease subunit|nr:ABC transporter permease [Clostridiales Family XIII bacterium]